MVMCLFYLYIFIVFFFATHIIFSSRPSPGSRGLDLGWGDCSDRPDQRIRSNPLIPTTADVNQQWIIWLTFIIYFVRRHFSSVRGGRNKATIILSANYSSRLPFISRGYTRLYCCDRSLWIQKYLNIFDRGFFMQFYPFFTGQLNSNYFCLKYRGCSW